MIYVVQAENGYIKIGSSSNPLVRLDTMQFASPLQLRLIAIFPGDYREERKLHDRFEKSRRHNEWFAADKDVIQFTAEVWGRGLPEVEEWVTDFSLLRQTKKQASAARRTVTMRAKRKALQETTWRAHLKEAAQ